jgi:tRNA A37 N6-isopentenylltransferase MiaA
MVLLGGGIGFVRHEREIGAARYEAQLKHEKQAVKAVGAAAAASAASETERRVAAIQEVVHATQQSASAVAADASTARAQRDAAIVQLRAYVRASALPASAASAAGSAPADDGLLAELLEASWQRNLSLAAEADQRGVAGSACERSYDSLKP